MKKKSLFIIAFAAIFCMGCLTSCVQDLRLCWEFTYTETDFWGSKTIVTCYEWLTEMERDARIQELEDDWSISNVSAQKASIRNSADCIGQHLRDGGVDTGGSGTNLDSHIIFDNQSNNPYDMFIDERNVGVINGHTTKKINVDPGKRYVRVKQKSGYMIYASEYDWNITVENGKDYTVNWTDNN